MKLISTKQAIQLLPPFQALNSYAEKVQFYDQHFDLLPHQLDFFDAQLNWFHISIKTSELVSAFNLEMDRTKNLYRKTFVEGAIQAVFDVLPQTRQQRIFLNQYIMEKHLRSKEEFREVILSSAPLTLAVLEQKRDQANQTIRWVMQKIQEGPLQTMRMKFLNLFYKGYAEFYGNEHLMQIRRKFIELYLYSQGVLFARYIEILSEEINRLKAITSAPKSYSLKEKYALLEQLGVINLIKKKCRIKNEDQRSQILTEMICALISESQAPGHTKNETCQTVEYLLSRENKSLHTLSLKEQEDLLQKLKNFK